MTHEFAALERQAQQAAEDSLTALQEAAYDGDVCECNTCVVREVLEASWPHLKALAAVEEADAERLSRDEYGKALVHVVKRRAACTRRKVGAVILDAAGRIAATGYNGTKAGAIHCTDGGCPRGAYSYDQVPGLLGNLGHPVVCVAQHAERNAICWALEHEVHLSSSTLYVSCQPCPDCDRLARGVGLRIVVAD